MPAVALSELLGQGEVSAYLRGIVGQARYGNAYLFHGPAGIGKGTAALAFARAALCERVPGARAASADVGPSLFGEAGAAPASTRDDACGECGGCRRAASLQHPDLKFLFPVSGPGDERELDETVGETLQAWRDDPLFTFQYEKAASIRLALTRELQRELAYRPFEAARRVVVIRDCDRMREDQYSALLKSIEEPGAATTWVLTTARLSRVPATIRSRCQRVRFAPLSESAIAAFLRERADVEERTARMLAALASGSLARALAMRGSDAVRLRDDALALLEPARRRDLSGLWKAAQGATQFGRAGRESLRRAIEFHELWLRDVLRARYGAPAETLVNRDQERRIREQAAQIDAAEVRRRLMVLEEALRAIEGNVSADLTLFSAMLRVAGERVGEGAWPAHAALRTDV
ncbi:MAG TPA: hypothetical protein VMH61_03865 [Candidatus Acidoferrales bacterium]|nr:hypothetical protein [Candidatus Acidoferrales bacterium]